MSDTAQAHGYLKGVCVCVYILEMNLFSMAKPTEMRKMESRMILFVLETYLLHTDLIFPVQLPPSEIFSPGKAKKRRQCLSDDALIIVIFRLMKQSSVKFCACKTAQMFTRVSLEGRSVRPGVPVLSVSINHCGGQPET